MQYTTEAGTVNVIKFGPDGAILRSDTRFALEVVVSGLELSGAALREDGTEPTTQTYADVDIVEVTPVDSFKYELEVARADLALYLQHEVLNYLS